MSSSLTLQDSSGAFWQLTLNDLGEFQTTSEASGPASSVLLNDSTNTSSWSIALLDPQERITATPAVFNAANPKMISLLSIPGSIAWAIGVIVVIAADGNQTGELETTRIATVARNIRLIRRSNRWKGFRKHR